MNFIVQKYLILYRNAFWQYEICFLRLCSFLVNRVTTFHQYTSESLHTSHCNVLSNTVSSKRCTPTIHNRLAFNISFKFNISNYWVVLLYLWSKCEAVIGSNRVTWCKLIWGIDRWTGQYLSTYWPINILTRQNGLSKHQVEPLR